MNRYVDNRVFVPESVSLPPTEDSRRWLVQAINDALDDGPTDPYCKHCKGFRRDGDPPNTFGHERCPIGAIWAYLRIGRRFEHEDWRP